MEEFRGEEEARVQQSPGPRGLIQTKLGAGRYAGGAALAGDSIRKLASVKEVGVRSGLGVEWVLWPEGTV